jgi:hypothetical protein
LIYGIAEERLSFANFDFVKKLIFLFCFLPGTFLLAQQPVVLKKKFFGTYSGEIATFKLDTGQDLVDIEKSVITVEIDPDSVTFRIGRNQLKGAYDVLFEAKKYYVLDCKIPGRLAGERVVVYKQGKRISRDGLFPQPSAMLNKLKD